MVRAAPLVAAVALSAPAFAYRPFDGTDAAVAEPGQLEIELGPIGLLRVKVRIDSWWSRR